MGNEILQVERLTAGFIEVGENVLFDSLAVVSDGISYDTVTGVITLLEAGRYQFDWWIATQASIAASAVFALVSSQGSTIIGNSPIKIGEVVGVGIIDVAVPPVTVELKNNSASEIFYATTVPVKSFLTVSGGQIQSFTPAYGGLYNDAEQFIEVPPEEEVQVPLPDPMATFNVLISTNTLQIVESGTYYIKSMITLQSTGLGVLIDAGVRINGAFSEPSLYSSFEAGGILQTYIIESIVVLNENDILDIAIVSATGGTFYLGFGREASLVIIKLNQ